jgi:hypothetical protein
MPRTGTFVQGTQPVRFWTNLINLPDSSTWRVRFLRPNATTLLDSGTVSFGNPFYRWSYWWWSYNVSLSTLGTYRILLDINGSTVADVPFDVVANAGEIVNRPPDAIAVSLEPAFPRVDDVLLCRVQTDLVLDDPDYDIVRYRYIWTVDGQVERDVTTAGHADAFPRDSAPAGSRVVCTVTPSDGTDSGPGAAAGVRIRPFRLKVFLGPFVALPVIEVISPAN